MNPLRDISPSQSPVQDQSNLTSGSPNAIPVDSIGSNSIARRQETQNSLRQASVALDAAYERVTQLRHNINSLLNRMPPEFAEGRSSARDSTPESSIAPQHAALVLTGSDDSGSDLDFNRRVERLRTIVSPSARQRLEDFENMSRRRRVSASERTLDMSHNRQQRWDAPSYGLLSPRARSPPLPDLILPANNRNSSSGSQEERSPFRRDFGIISPDDPSTMIGRRVAARTAVTSSGHQSITTLPLEQQLQDQTSLIARDLAGLASRLVLRGVRRGGAARQAESRPPIPNDGIIRATSDPDMDWEAPASQSYNDSLLASMSGSVISNSSIYSQPSSDINTRWSSERTSQRGEDRVHDPSNLPPPHYVIARSWPRQGTTASETSTFIGVRHNADGDEIISDDEDENERNHRSRLRFVPDTMPPQSDEDFFLPFASTTTTTTIQSLDDESEAIRVRINVHQESKDAFFFSSSSPTYPQHVDPLPTPISEMLRHPVEPPQVPRFIPVSKHANFAGR